MDATFFHYGTLFGEVRGKYCLGNSRTVEHSDSLALVMSVARDFVNSFEGMCSKELWLRPLSSTRGLLYLVQSENALCVRIMYIKILQFRGRVERSNATMALVHWSRSA